MSTRIAFLPMVIALLAMPACLERKHATSDGGGQPGEAGAPDTIVGPVIDGGAPAVDTSGLDLGVLPSPVDTAPDLADLDLPPVGLDGAGMPEIPRVDVLIGPDLPADAPLPDVPADLPPVSTDTPADTPADVGPDTPLTNTDAPGTCPSTQRLCTTSAGSSCIDLAACCTRADCTGTCQTCNASHACVPAPSQADPTGRCLGTCDSTGACKSKQGQSCTAVAGGCVSGTSCAPDGVCCESSCTSPCMACDIPSSLGLCKPVTSGSPHAGHTSCATRGGALYVGRLSAEKGIGELVGVWPGSAPKLTIAGSGPLASEIRRAARENVDLLGAVEPDRVRELMRAAGAVVMPSLWPEGQPLAMLEALSEGVPVVGFEGTAIADAVGERFPDGIAPNRNFKMLVAAAMSQLRADPEDNRRRAVTLFESRYTHELNTAALLGIYARAIDARA